MRSAHFPERNRQPKDNRIDMMDRGAPQNSKTRRGSWGRRRAPTTPFLAQKRKSEKRANDLVQLSDPLAADGEAGVSVF